VVQVVAVDHAAVVAGQAEHHAPRRGKAHTDAAIVVNDLGVASLELDQVLVGDRVPELAQRVKLTGCDKIAV